MGKFRLVRDPTLSCMTTFPRESIHAPLARRTSSERATPHRLHPPQICCNFWTHIDEFVCVQTLSCMTVNAHELVIPMRALCTHSDCTTDRFGPRCQEAVSLESVPPRVHRLISTSTLPFVPMTQVVHDWRRYHTKYCSDNASRTLGSHNVPLPAHSSLDPIPYQKFFRDRGGTWRRMGRGTALVP